MTTGITMLRLRLASAFVAGLLMAIVGLFWLDGTPQVVAQSDTTAPIISTIEITSATEDGVGITIPGRERLVRPSGRNGAYGIGDDIEVTVTFSESVTVSGAPQLQLNVGSSSKTADYDSAEGSSVVFSYTVAEGDLDTNGLSIQADKLKLNGGRVRNGAGSDADLSHGALPDQENHKVDGIRPWIYKIRFRGLPTYGAYFHTAGADFDVVPAFTEPVYVSAIGQAQITLDVGNVEKTAELVGRWYVSRNESRFEYRVQEGDLDLDGVSFAANALTLEGGATVRDAAGNDAVLTHPAVTNTAMKVDAVVPTVSSVAITSDPGDDDTYGAGDRIEVTVTFSEDVSVPLISRTDLPGYRWPQLELDIGGEAKTAEYQSFTGAKVVFGYSVRAGDSDDNGIAIGANKLSLNGGAISDEAGNYPNPIGAGIRILDVPHEAVVSHDAVSDDAGHKVDVPPSPLTLSGDTTLHIKESSSSSVARYRVSGTDGSLIWSLIWSLSGDDSDDFEIFGGGIVYWVSSPNYEKPTDADTDNRYKVTIQASDGTNEAKLQVTVVVTNEPLDADELPTVAGTAQVGETLTADTSLITFDPYDLGRFYFWLRSDGTTDTEIEGAEGSSSYTLVAADEGHTIKVRVNFHSPWLVSLTSEPTAIVAAKPNASANSPATGAPTISGTAYVGSTLAADTSGISDTDGLTNGTFSYQWIRNDRTTDTDVSGATGATHTLVEADEGKNIKVRVSFTDDAGNQESLTSAPTATVAVRATPLTGLTVNPGTLAPAFHSYTFNYAVPDIANSDSRITVDATVKDGYEYEIAPVEDGGLIGTTDPGSLSGWHITDGSGNTFEPLTDADANSPGFQIDLDEGESHFAIRVYRGVGDFGEFYWLTITRAANSPATSAPAISGTAQVGETLTTDTSGISDADGLSGATFTHQWIRNDGTTDADISGATGATYTLLADDEGKTIKVRVTFTDDAGNEESLTSEPTDVVPEPSGPTATVELSPSGPRGRRHGNHRNDDLRQPGV